MVEFRVGQTQILTRLVDDLAPFSHFKILIPYRDSPWSAKQAGVNDLSIDPIGVYQNTTIIQTHTEREKG